jgi:hypothetical protein
MRTQPSNKKRAHSIPKARTERMKKSLPYMLGVASFRRRGGIKLKQPSPVLQPLTAPHRRCMDARHVLPESIFAKMKINNMMVEKYETESNT